MLDFVKVEVARWYLWWWRRWWWWFRMVNETTRTRTALMMIWRMRTRAETISPWGQKVCWPSCQHFPLNTVGSHNTLSICTQTVLFCDSPHNIACTICIGMQPNVNVIQCNEKWYNARNLLHVLSTERQSMHCTVSLLSSCVKKHKWAPHLQKICETETMSLSQVGLNSAFSFKVT